MGLPVPAGNFEEGRQSRRPDSTGSRKRDEKRHSLPRWTMSHWAAEEYRALPLAEIDVRYGRYRLSVLEAEEAMARSLRRYGQISAVVVCLMEGVPVLIDGFIVTAAALVAVRHNPSCRHWLMFAHRSSENGHASLLSALAAEPLLDLGMRLGEGSGAALALPIVRLACAVHAQMATFAEAGVSGAA